jgi:hypothetical protein
MLDLDKINNVYQGKINLLRPISLLEYFGKPYLKVFFSHTSKTIVEHQILTGVTGSRFPGTSIFDSLLWLSVFLYQVKRTHCKDSVFLEGFSAASGCINLAHIAISL